MTSQYWASPPECMTRNTFTNDSGLNANVQLKRVILCVDEYSANECFLIHRKSMCACVKIGHTVTAKFTFGHRVTANFGARSRGHSVFLAVTNCDPGRGRFYGVNGGDHPLQL